MAIANTPPGSPDGSRRSSRGSSRAWGSPPPLGPREVDPARLVAERVDLTLARGNSVSAMTQTQQQEVRERFNVIKQLFVNGAHTTDFEINFTFKTVSWTDAQGVKQVRDIHEGLFPADIARVDRELKELTVFIENTVWKGLDLKIFTRNFDAEHKGLSPSDGQVRIIERHFESKTSAPLQGCPNQEAYEHLFADPAFIALDQPHKNEVVHRMLRLEKLMSSWKQVNNEREPTLERRVVGLQQDLDAVRLNLHAAPPPQEPERIRLETGIARLDQEIQKLTKEKDELISLNHKLDNVDLFALEKAFLYYPFGAPGGILPANVMAQAKKLADDLKRDVKGTPRVEPTASRWEQVGQAVQSVYYRFHGEDEQSDYAHQVAGLLFSGLKPGQMREAYFQFCQEQHAPMAEVTLEDALMRWVLLPTPLGMPELPDLNGWLGDVPAEDEPARFSFAKQDLKDRLNREMQPLVFDPRENFQNVAAVTAKREELGLGL